MKRKESQVLRLKQLTKQLNPQNTLEAVQRPVGGWLRAVRQALGLSLKSVAARLQLSPQAIHQLEKSEAASSISVKQLEAVAEAMGCRVVYTLVPRHGTLTDLADVGKNEARRSVQHSMSLEDQAIEQPEEMP